MVLFRIKTFTCRATAARLSLAEDRTVSALARLTTALHLLVCRRCRGYARHLATLHALGRSVPGLGIEARDRILNVLARNRR